MSNELHTILSRPLHSEKPVATLQINLTTDRDPNKFTCELYEVYTDKNNNQGKTSPSDWEVSSFYRKFKHGCNYIRHGGFHHKFEVPISILSTRLFNEFTCLTSNQETVLDISSAAQAEIDRLNKLDSSLSCQIIESQDATYQANLQFQLAKHQLIAAKCMQAKGNFALYHEPGCGKTAPSIEYARVVCENTTRDANRTARVLILGPKNVRDNWRQELNRFLPHDFLKKSCIRTIAGTSKERTDRSVATLLSQKHAFLIMGYEGFCNTPILHGIEWDLVILDESHNIADPRTLRTKTIMKLRDNSRNRIILTGTPIRNAPWDYWAQFEFLDRGLSGFDTYNACKEFFGQWAAKPGSKYRICETLQNIPVLKDIIARNAHVVSKKEALPNLPEKRFSTRSIFLQPKQKEIYESVAEELMAELDSILGGETDSITVRSQLTKLLRLAEITSGYCVSDNSGVIRFDPNPKLEALVDFLKDEVDDNEKVIVWAVYRQNIKTIAARLRLEFGDDTLGINPCVTFYGETSDEDRKEAIKRFNSDPKCKVFVGHPGSGGVGVNLLGYNYWDEESKWQDTNAAYIINFSLNWSSVNKLQSDDRLYRRGTRVSPEIIDFIVPGSIDEYIKDRVGMKIELGRDLQDVKDILSNIMKISNGD